MNAIKAVAPDGTFTAQAIRFGSPTEPDRQRDFFTAKTQLMMDQWAWPRPILWEHGVMPGTFGVVLGQWTGYEKRADGVYLRGRLDTQHPRYAQIKRDIDAGRYFVSSDSAPHLVKRASAPNNTNELTHWTWITASLTRSPAEHRLLPVAAVKRLALKAGARHSRMDMQHIQGAHDAMVKAGAVCAPAGKAQTSKAFYADVAKAYGQRYADDLHREILLEEIREVKILAELDQLERT